MRGYMLKLVAVRIYALDYAVQLRLYQITSKRETVFALENIICRGRDIFFGIKQANNVRGKRNIAQGGICFWSILKIAAPVEIFYGSPNVKNIFIEVDIAEFKSAKFAVAKPGS